MTDEHRDDQLLRIAGPDRARHSAEEVAGAEASLRNRLDSLRAETAERVLTTGRVCVVLGAACIVVPVLMLSSEPPTSGEPHLAATMLMQGICGLALVIGGIALRRRSALGRKLIMGVACLTAVWVIGFTLYFIPTAVSGMPWAGAIGLGGLAVLVAVLWIVLLARVLRFMRSALVLRWTREHAA